MTNKALDSPCAFLTPTLNAVEKYQQYLMLFYRILSDLYNSYIMGIFIVILMTAGTGGVALL